MGFSPSMAFNIGQGATAAGLSLFGGNRPSQAPDIYAAANAPFMQALDMQRQAYQQEAELQRQQALQAIQEAGREAAQKRREVDSFVQDQALAYLGSGVILEGSPMKVMADSTTKGQEEIDAIIRRGKAQADLLNQRSLIGERSGYATLLGEKNKFELNRAQAAIYDAQTSRAGSQGLAKALDGLGKLLPNSTGAKKQKAATPPKKPPQISQAPTLTKPSNLFLYGT